MDKISIDKEKDFILDTLVHSIPYSILYYKPGDIKAEFYCVDEEFINEIYKINENKKYLDEDIDTIIIEYFPYPNKNIKGIHYIKDFKMNRYSLPASITFNKDGSLNRIKYFNNGLYHRENSKPAFYEYENNQIKKTYYYHMGRPYDPEKYNYKY